MAELTSTANIRTHTLMDTECLKYYKQVALENATRLQLLNFITSIPVIACLTIFGMIGNTLSCFILPSGNSTSFLLKCLAICDNAALICFTIVYTFPAIYQYFGVLIELFEFTHLTNNYLWFLMWTSKTCSVYVLVS
jgi:hypothetical protein